MHFLIFKRLTIFNFIFWHFNLNFYFFLIPTSIINFWCFSILSIKVPFSECLKILSKVIIICYNIRKSFHSLSPPPQQSPFFNFKTFRKINNFPPFSNLLLHLLSLQKFLKHFRSIVKEKRLCLSLPMYGYKAVISFSFIGSSVFLFLLFSSSFATKKEKSHYYYYCSIV